MSGQGEGGWEASYKPMATVQVRGGGRLGDRSGHGASDWMW